MEQFTKKKSKVLYDDGKHDNQVHTPPPPQQFTTAQVERLKIKAALHQAARNIEKLNLEITEISPQEKDCEACRQTLYQTAQEKFISHKLKLLSQDNNFDQRMEDHLCTRDSIMLLGEVVRSCLPPTASTDQVWTAIADRIKELRKQ